MIGLLLVFACVVAFGGIAAGWDTIKQFVVSAFEMVKGLLVWAIKFPDELGITDWLWTWGIYACVAVVAAVLAGYAFTREEKKKLLGGISTVVGVISLLLTFA